MFLKQYVYMSLFRSDSTFTDMEVNQSIPELLNSNAIYFYCSVCQSEEKIQQVRDNYPLNCNIKCEKGDFTSFLLFT